MHAHACRRERPLAPAASGAEPALRGGAICVLLAIAPALGLALCGAAPAAAQESVMIDGVRPEIHVGLGWDAELGVGARVDIPIVPSGFVDDAHDEFALSPGADVFFDDGDGVGVAALLAAQWNFYLRPEWSVFPELGLALIFGDHDRGRRNDDDDVRLRPLFAVGGRYHWSRRNALVLRVGWPLGIQVGVTF
jgi:hypothetical protein